MRAIFDAITRLALRFRWVTLTVTLVFIVAGIYSYTQLNQELIPDIEFPQTFILSQDGGASSEQILHTYSIPLENSTSDISGVVNVESTSQKGLSFITVRNEFGQDQDRVTEDVQKAVDNLVLPVRRLVPADGSTPSSMIAELSPEAVAWLIDYSVREDVPFSQLLIEKAWRSFSPEALGAFAEETFNNLETSLREDLIAKRVGGEIDVPSEAPALPNSWQEDRDDIDRFVTVEDIAELTTNRNFADIFNGLIDDGFVVGGLGTTDDLTPADLAIFIDIQNRCEAFRAETNTPSVASENPCSFIGQLSADAILAFSDDILSALPADYLQSLSFADRNTLASNYLATELTGTSTPSPSALLPDPWRMDAPSILTFSFSDLPLGYITISSDSLTEDELEELVENNLLPRIKDLDDVASVVVFGGGQIVFKDETFVEQPSETDASPSDDSEPTITSPALPDLWVTAVGGALGGEFSDAQSVVDFVAASEDYASIAELLNVAADRPEGSLVVTPLTADVLLYWGENEADFFVNLSEATLGLLDAQVLADLPVEAPAQDGGATENTDETDESPALPELWVTAVGGALGGEFSDAQSVVDFVAASEDYASVAELLNVAADRPEGAFVIAPLTTDVLLYWDQVEEGFLSNLNPAVFENLDEAVVAQLSGESPVPDQPAQIEPVALGKYWNELSAQLAGSGKSLVTTADLVAFEGDPAQTLATIVGALEAGGHHDFAVLLVNDLTPEALEAIFAEDEHFLANLAESENGQIALSYLNETALQNEAVSSFINGLEGDLQARLTAIRDGEQATAIEGIDTGPQIEVLDDENAPNLPGSWTPVGNFIGAKLERADDIINTRNLPDYASGADLINQFAVNDQGAPLVRELPAEVWNYLGENETTFWQEVSAVALRLIPENVVADLPQDVQNRINNGSGDFVPPSAPITRTNQKSSLVLTIFKNDDANTVEAWAEVQEVLNDLPEGIDVDVPFEQASFIEESINGVRNEGTSGAVMAILVILIFMNLSVRSTLVTSISIPASVMIALVFMSFLPQNVYKILAPMLDDVGRDSTMGSILEVILRLFPRTYTLNIMTLSGLTVAIGRVVDDSIVVLENIYRNIMHGEEKHSAVLNGTREVSVAIFAATLTTMVVFLPLGLFGGVTGAFFLPFGLAVTYSLAGSFIVAITTVPVLAELFISKEAMPEEGVTPITPTMSATEKIITRVRNGFISTIDSLSKVYSVAIKWALNHRWATIGLALLTLFFGMYLLSTRPQTFLPAFGNPTITINVNLPAELADGSPVTIALTEQKVAELEQYLADQPGVETIQTVIGGELNSFDPTLDPNALIETKASIQVGMATQADLDNLLDGLRAESEAIFNDLNGDGQIDPNASNVRVSGVQASGDFGGFSLVLSGPEGVTLDELSQFNALMLEELSSIDGLVNVDSSLGGLGGGNGTTFIRIDGIPAIRYTGELETSDTLGVTEEALTKTQGAVDAFREDNSQLTTPITVTKGFESEQQEEGFRQIGVSMLIATLIVYFLLALTFNHLVHPITILISLPLSVVGAAVALTLTGRVLGLSAMIGLLMLIGIVVTNAVVFLDRVQQNRREKNMNSYDALVEAGEVRLRPILMTAVSTMMGVMPLAFGFAEGAIIAAELGTVVLGGLVSSTFLTLLVVPVVYSLFDTAQTRVFGLFGRKQKAA